MPERQEIRLLGVFGATVDDKPVNGLTSPRAQSLLAYLILHRSAPQPRQHLAYLLWPESNEGQARTNLRKTLHHIRQALPAADDCLLTTRTTLQWSPDAPYCVDVLKLEAHLALAESGSLVQHAGDPSDDTAGNIPNQGAVCALRRVADHYAGELLPDCYDDWIIPARTALAQRVRDALAQLVHWLEDARAYAEAVRYAQQRYEMDTLDEAAFRQLLRLHALDGNRTAAVTAYQRFEAELARELDVEPDAETRAIYERALAAGESDGAHAPTDATHRDTEPLVGRTQEWQHVRDAWQHALHGHAGLVALTGEAGIGKTRLGEELLTWAQRQGYRTARTRSYAAHGALAYAPIADLLRTDSLAPQLGELDDVWLSEISRLLPEWLQERPALSAPQPMAESWQRQRFFDALARALAVDDSPLLVLFDDLQWSDRDTLEWLTYTLQHGPQVRLLVVGTVRTDEVDAAHPYADLALALAHSDQFTEVALRPLDLAQTEQLARQVASRNLSDEEADRLYTDTGGNPLFVVETARAGDAVQSPPSFAESEPQHPIARLPAKVHTVIRGRLAQLSPRAQELTSLAAVAGRSFTYNVLQAASRQDSATLTEGLEELLHRRIILERGPDAFDFSHDRIRDVAYAEISSVRRRLLHDRLAQTLLQLFDSDPDSISGQLAEHFVQAGRKPEAVDYLVRAGDRSAAQYANEEALNYYARALSLLPQDALERRYEILVRRLEIHARTLEVERRPDDLDEMERVIDRLSGDPDANPKECARRRAELLSLRSSYTYQIGELEKSIAFGEEAIIQAKLSADPYVDAAARIALGLSYWAGGKMRKVRELYEEPLKWATEAGELTLCAQFMLSWAATGMFSGMPSDDIQDYLRRSLAIYERVDDLVGQANCNNKMGYVIVHGFEGSADEAMHRYERALELAESSGSSFWIATSESNIGYLHCLLGDYASAQVHHERSLVLSSEVDHTQRLGSVLVYIGFEQRSRGDYMAAIASQQDALAQLSKIRMSLWSTWAHRELALAYRALGDYEAAQREARRAIEVAREFGDTRQEGYALMALGLAEEDQGRAGAADCFHQAYDCYVRMELYNRSMAPLAGLARLADSAGDRERSLHYVEQMAEHLANHELDKTEEAFRIHVTCYRLLQTAGDPRASDFLAAAQQNLRARAASLSEVEHLRLFWDMTDHRDIRDTDPPRKRSR